MQEVLPLHPTFRKAIHCLTANVNDVFVQKLYTGELSVAEVVATLSSFSKGSNREKQVFHCMVHNLFDEYQFFTKYPDKVTSVPAIQLRMQMV